jgi:hypothetical protein
MITSFRNVSSASQLAFGVSAGWNGPVGHGARV